MGVNSTPGTKGPVYGVNTASRVPVGALHTAHFSWRRRSEMEGTSNTRLIEWVTDKYRSYNPYISFKLHLDSYNNLFIVIVVFKWVCIDILVQKDRINQQPSSITTAARYSSDSFDQRLERKLRTCDSMS